MTVTFTALTTGSDTTNQTGPYNTATITPAANQPVLVAVFTHVASGTTPPVTVSGCGLTWTQVDATVAAAHTATLFIGLGSSPIAGPLSIAGDGVITTAAALWQVTQASGVDTTTANGVVQSVNAKPASAASVSVAFGTAVTSGNGTYAGVGIQVQQAPAAGTGWTSLGTTTQSGPVSGLLGEGASTPQQNITASWTTAAASYVVGVELAAPAGSTNFTGTASFSGSGSLLTLPAQLYPSDGLYPSDTLYPGGTSGGGAPTSSGTAAFSGAGSLSTPAVTASGSASFSAVGTVALSGAQLVRGAAALTGTGKLVAGVPSAQPVPSPDAVWPPDPYRAAIRSGGYALTYTVDATYRGVAVAGATGMAPTGGTITDTTKPGVRRVLNLELAPEPGLYDKLAPIGTTLTVTAHVRYPNQQTQDIPMGVFDVDSEQLTEGGGGLSLTAPDKWVRIQRARFMGPASATVGVRVTSQITSLIRGALGASEPVVVKATSTATMKALTWEKDRDQAILDLAKSIGAWVFFDRNGVATIADIPVVKASADWLVDSSPNGVLISLDRQKTRTETRNVVVVSSSAASGPAFPTVYVWDADPTSPTFAAGGTGTGFTPPVATSASSFGLVPYYYDTPVLTTSSQAFATGKTILSRTTGLASQVSLERAPNPAMDAFDSMDVLPPRARYDIARVLERHVADTITHPLTLAPMHIDGRSTRTDDYVGG